MYPWFHLHHPGYPAPPPPAAGPTVFAEAANSAAAAGSQHHVYLHGMKGYGRGWGYRRGPSRFKWFVLGAVAATVFLNHRYKQRLRNGDDEPCDPRNFFWACRQRRNDLPGPSGPSQPAFRPASAPNDAQGDEERQWRSRWHERWHRSEKGRDAAPVSTAKVETTQAPLPTNNVPSATKQAPSEVTVEPDLLTYDSPLLGRNDASNQRDRMEAEAIAFAEEKIDMLVGLLEGLKSKLESSGKTRS